MKIYRKIPMAFEGKTYEIRVYYTDTLINIITFRNSHPANGLRHQIQIPKKCNVQNILKQDILEELVEMSRKDIIEKRGEKLSGIIRENTVIKK